MPRRPRPGGALVALAALAAAAALPAPARAQLTSEEQRCVSVLNGAWLALLKARDADALRCLKQVAAGKAAPEACLGADATGKVAKAEARAAKAAEKHCPDPGPVFGATSASTVAAAAADAADAGLEALFGADPALVAKAADAEGAACQQEAAKRQLKLLETWAAEANKAKRAALRGAKGAVPAADAAALGAAIDAALAASAKLAKARDGLASAIAGRCPADRLDELFDCGDAATPEELAACAADAAADAACSALEAADGLTLDCPHEALEVGAASRSVLPLVDGSYDYLGAGFPARGDPFDPGIPVPAWDDGRIAVGNGASESFWVRDDVRATAVALRRRGQPEIVVIVATDLYMVFRVDADGIRAKVAELVGSQLAGRLRILVTATHNHHGPDTAFDVNHDWYEHMTDQVAAAVAEAVSNRRPATLQVAAGAHWFGAKDGTDPQIYDPSLHVLQASDANGDAIATLVQWNDHPEATLGWEPPLEAIEDDCALLGLVGDECRAEGRYFTADFPGILREDLKARYGGEVAFLNGALGVIIGPGGAQVWEVDETHPLGNQMVAPPGAVAPGGGTNYTEENFRRTEIIGEQLALAVGRLLDAATPLDRPLLSYDVHPFYTRLSNFGFRVLTVVDEETGRPSLGHTPAPLYECPPLGPKSDATCVDDGFEVLQDGAVGVAYRKGDHVKTAVEYVRLGPIGMMFLTGEIPSEITNGLPAGFRTAPEAWYAEDPELHAQGAAFTIPGFVRQRMSDTYEWTIGLGSDQLGYHVPISNFRALCVGDELIGEGVCQELYESGSIEYPDAVAGTTCKQVAESPTGTEPFLVVASCRYGQALGEADGHYEETNSAGWDLVEDLMDAVAALTGSEDSTEVNPDFPGWWPGRLPPGDLP